MRENNRDNRRQARTGATDLRTRTGPAAYTAAQRKTMRQGLRILARIIASAHLRRQADRSSTAAPRPAAGTPARRASDSRSRRP